MKQLTRRDFLKATGAAVVAAAFGVYEFIPGTKSVAKQAVKATKATAAHYKLTSDVDAANIRQVITADSRTSRTIMWQSSYDEAEAVVEYRLKDAEDTLTVSATDTQFSDGGGQTYIHSAAISGLTPGTDYEYRVGYADKRSSWLPLKTADGTDFKALIFPDSQSADYSVWRNTAMPAWERNQDARFFINIGDLVDNGQADYQWNAWFDACEDMIRRIPVVPLDGNHEMYDLDWQMHMALSYTHLFELPKNGLPDYPNQFYSFDWGDIHFTVLDTQFTELKDFEPNLLEDEVAWFKEDMEKTKAPWKIVLMHKDVLQYSFNQETRPTAREEGFSDEGKIFMPLFDRYGVDVVLSGHLHTYRNRGRIRNFKRDETGTLYLLTGVAGDVRYPSLWKRHSLDIYVPPQPETDNYMTMEATANSVRFRCFLPDGTLLDTAEIRK